MTASQALDVIRRHGTPRDVQVALYYVTRGRTAMLLDLARSLQPSAGGDESTAPSRPAATAGRIGLRTVVDVPLRGDAVTADHQG